MCEGRASGQVLYATDSVVIKIEHSKVPAHRQPFLKEKKKKGKTNNVKAIKTTPFIAQYTSI